MHKAFFITGGEPKDKTVQPQASRFYQLMSYFLSYKGVQCESEEFKGQFLDRLIPKDTTILLGHSEGASAIAKEYDYANLKKVRYIILFDPEEEQLKNLETSPVKKSIFFSYDKAPEGEILIPHRVMEDNPYFNETMAEIHKNLDSFLD